MGTQPTLILEIICHPSRHCSNIDNLRLLLFNFSLLNKQCINFVYLSINLERWEANVASAEMLLMLIHENMKLQAEDSLMELLSRNTQKVGLQFYKTISICAFSQAIRTLTLKTYNFDNSHFNVNTIG